MLFQLTTDDDTCYQKLTKRLPQRDRSAASAKKFGAVSQDLSELCSNAPWNGVYPVSCFENTAEVFINEYPSRT